MPGPSVVFNSLSSLYFEVESGELGLPHEEGACLSPSLHTENEQEQDLFQG
jgi:hypothetical protein